MSGIEQIVEELNGDNQVLKLGDCVNSKPNKEATKEFVRNVFGIHLKEYTDKSGQKKTFNASDYMHNIYTNTVDSDYESIFSEAFSEVLAETVDASYEVIKNSNGFDRAENRFMSKYAPYKTFEGHIIKNDAKKSYIMTKLSGVKSIDEAIKALYVLDDDSELLEELKKEFAEKGFKDYDAFSPHLVDRIVENYLRKDRVSFAVVDFAGSQKYGMLCGMLDFVNMSQSELPLLDRIFQSEAYKNLMTYSALQANNNSSVPSLSIKMQTMSELYNPTFQPHME